MAVAQRDFEIPAGGTVEFIVDVIGGPADLTGYTGAMQIRELRSDIVALADIGPADITVDVPNRQVTVRIPSDVTSTFLWERGVYDVKITGPDGAWRLVEGRVTNSLPVTRED